jgi:hypothetical protein
VHTQNTNLHQQQHYKEYNAQNAIKWKIENKSQLENEAAAEG